MSKPTTSIVLVSAIYVTGIGLAVWRGVDDAALQTWAVVLTGIVVILYTHETARLRIATYAQLELQLRPFVIVKPVDGRFEIANIGAGTALNISVDEIIISKELEVTIRFPSLIAVLQSGNTATLTAKSYHGDVDAGDFFLGHLDPEYAQSEQELKIRFQNVETKPYLVSEKIRPGAFEIIGLSTNAL